MRCWRACAATLDRDPLLIVPTGDDIARFERDLCADGRPSIGATIRTFASLTDEIAATTAARVPPALTPPQRLALIRAATAATPVQDARAARRARRASPRRSTLLIAELQAALVSPADLRAAADAAGDADYELELAALYEAYEGLRDRRRRARTPARSPSPPPRPCERSPGPGASDRSSCTASTT